MSESEEVERNTNGGVMKEDKIHRSQVMCSDRISARKNYLLFTGMIKDAIDMGFTQMKIEIVDCATITEQAEEIENLKKDKEYLHGLADQLSDSREREKELVGIVKHNIGFTDGVVKRLEAQLSDSREREKELVGIVKHNIGFTDGVVKRLEAQLSASREREKEYREVLYNIQHNGWSDQPEELWGDPSDIAEAVLAKHKKINPTTNNN